MSRRLVPTKLGIALVHGYHRIDPELVLPLVRANVEKSVDHIAKGNADRDLVVAHLLTIFTQKYKYFVEKVGFITAAVDPHSCGCFPSDHSYG